MHCGRDTLNYDFGRKTFREGLTATGWPRFIKIVEMRLPAEWEKQSGVQLTWPHRDTEWYQIDRVLECYVDIARNILDFEPLMIVARDIDEAKNDIAEVCARTGMSLDADMIKFYEDPLNDTWARDHV